MDFDEARRIQKRQEIIDVVQQTLRSHTPSADEPTAAISIVSQLAEITAPEAPSIGFVRVYEGGDGGGRSTKPGNVRLNMKKLFVAVAGGALTLAGATAAPWMVILGGLVVWDSLWSSTQVELGEVEAAVLWALWSNRDDQDMVSKDGVFELVTAELHKLDRPGFTGGQVDAALAKLRQLKCIESAMMAPDKWWLREWVQVDYR
jgi:hypothetical protein